MALSGSLLEIARTGSTEHQASLVVSTETWNQLCTLGKVLTCMTSSFARSARMTAQDLLAAAPVSVAAQIAIMEVP